MPLDAFGVLWGALRLEAQQPPPSQKNNPECPPGGSSLGAGSRFWGGLCFFPTRPGTKAIQCSGLTAGSLRSVGILVCFCFAGAITKPIVVRPCVMEGSPTPAAAEAPAAPAAPTGSATSANPTDLGDAVWGPRNSVKERWPGMTEEEINNQIEQTYPKTLMTRPWYDSQGNRAIFGAASNPRRIMKAQLRYGRRVLAMGLRMQDRSDPIGFAPAENPEHTHLLSGKQLAEACYRVFEQHPGPGAPSSVVRTREMGYPVLMMSNRVPVDVQKQIVACGNLFHDGQSQTMTEVLDKVGGIQQHWSRPLV